MDPRLESLVAAGALAAITATAAISLGSYMRAGPQSPGTAGSALLGPRLRAWYFSLLQPLEDALARRGITPTTVTVAQALCSIPIAATYAAGWLYTAGWLVLAIGSLDIIDGRLARRSGLSSERGAFLDSVFDRYADSLTYVGLAVFFRESAVLWLVLLAMVGTTMVSYARARAEALFVDGRAGLFQRPERTVVLGFGTIFSSLFDHIAGVWLGVPANAILIGVIAILAVMTNVSAAQRIADAGRQLGERMR